MKSIILFASFFLLLSACSIKSTINAQNVDNEIQAIENNLIQTIQIRTDPKRGFNLEERMRYHSVPGVSVAVVKDGRLLWSKAYGVRDNETKEELDVNTLLQAASISKAVTAIGVLKLIQDEKLDIDLNINQYLKSWKVPENEFTTKEKVTIRRALTHTAGLNLHGFDGYLQDSILPSAVEILNGEGESRQVLVDEVPGSRWRYSGGGYIILQLLIEDLTGRDFEEYMNTEILKPFGMTNSVYQQPLDTSKYKNVSSGHGENGRVIEGKWRNFAEKGPGGLWTTPTDLAKLCLALQKIRAGKKSEVLSKSTVSSMLEKHSERNWGLGPLIQGTGDSIIFRHDGRNNGYLADFVAFADQGIAAVVMTNADKGNRLKNEIMMAISDYYKWNFENPEIIDPIDLSTKDFQKYLGVYDWIERPGYFIEVIIKDSKLNVIAPGFPDDILTPTDESNFIDVETAVRVKFKTAEDGAINGLTWRGRFNFRKVQ